MVLVGVHPDVSVQRALGSPSVCPQQNRQCHLVPGQAVGKSCLRFAFIVLAIT